MMLRLFLVTLPLFIAGDIIWIGRIAKTFYHTQIGFLLKEQVDWRAAIVFYLLFSLGLVVFVTLPALRNHSWVEALVKGAFFGLITYATYDLTNQATVKNWPYLVTVVDLTWGTFLSMSVSLISFWLGSKFL